MVLMLRTLKSRWWRFPVTWWWRSLPLRVVLTVFVASVLVLVLGGFLLMQQATIGVIDGKKETAENEARQAVNTAQQQLNAADLTGEVNVDKLLLDLATGFANRPGEQFEVIIISRGQTITAGNAAISSIPDALRKQVEQSNDLLMTPTQIDYRDMRPSVAGLAAGATLTLPLTGRYQIYLMFPLTQEVATLAVLRYAVVTTGAILVILLTFIAALVSRQVVTPVRAARRAAESLASGNLHDRMKVRGPRRPGTPGNVDELHGLRAGETDQYARRAVCGPAAIRLRRLARASYAVDHRADGVGGVVRGA